MRALVFFLLFLLFATDAQSQEHTYECSCSGSLRVAKFKGNGKVRWRERFYQFQVWQHTFSDGNNVLNISQHFMRTGWVSKGGRLKKVGLTADGQAVLYQNRNYFLQVPRAPGEPVMIKQKVRVPVGAMDVLNEWQQLCPRPVNP